MRVLMALSTSVLVAACSHNSPPVQDVEIVRPASSTSLMTRYSVSVEAALPDLRVSREEVSSFRSDGRGETVMFVYLENLPAGVADLSDAHGSESRTLMVGMQPMRGGDGRITYDIHLAFQDDAHARPFGLEESPRLVVAEGETATVHLGQEAGDIYSRLVIDLTSHTVSD